MQQSATPEVPQCTALRALQISQEEFKARYLKTVLPKNLERKISSPASSKRSSADWTGTYTTPVKDQVNIVCVL